jgi:peptidoglycan hydrolase-like protein with peptidoglycan-binding domain
VKRLNQLVRSLLSSFPEPSGQAGEQLTLFTQRPILHIDSTPQSMQEAINELQSALKAKGLLLDPDGKYPNSKFDLETKQAVEVFQQENRLCIDGVVGPLTWACLYHPQLSRRDQDNSLEKQKAIQKLQHILRAEGLPIREQDGHFGRQTEKAVKVFQEFYGLKADGIVGAWTWTVLLGVRQKSEIQYRFGRWSFGGVFLVRLFHENWSLWEQLLKVICILLGIYLNPSKGFPEPFPALIIAYGLTCITHALLETPKIKQLVQSLPSFLKYAPYVLTGIYWASVLNALEILIKAATPTSS